ncbi:hypothetical protein LJ739_17100 [Aestuariibacter halophilus]|uniref:STAS domain-containing protein n=1 Tax=Fluctibacter halophilus TaxID=226011 RepID=A0ABS8GC39_9ALTE|nr:hypothetical protein [Aestuariibacter halophilus]MCC2617974.1 hypothetical protein [Aestuariibacter halophilus]
MNVAFCIVENIVWVRFSGHIDALDLIQLSADDNYLESLRKYRRVIFDYSQATSVNMGFEEIRQLSTITRVECNFTEHLHGAIVPLDDAGWIRAKRYAETVKPYGWEMVIVDSTEQAFEHLGARIPG